MPDPTGPSNPDVLSKIPKPVLYIGAAGLALVAFIFYRNRKNAAAAAAAANPSGTSIPSGAAAGAYGAPLPGSGILQPILLQQPYNPPTLPAPSVTINNPTPAPPSTPPVSAAQPSPPVPAAGIPPPIAAFLNGATPLPGENIAQEVQDPAGGWLALTNKGGVYTYGGAPFFGSYLGYAGQTKNPAAEEAGRGAFTQIVPHADGSYTLIDQHGETYNFGPGTPKSAGGTA